MRLAIKRFADQHALAVSATVVLVYLVCFLVPGVLTSNSFGRGETHADTSSMMSLFWGELLLLGSIFTVIMLFGWAQSARFTSPVRRHSVWWVMPPLLFIGGFLGVVVAIITLTSFDVVPAPSGILTLIATITLIAAFEELLFRGLLFRGLESKAGPIWALILSSVAFGLMHSIVAAGGSPFDFGSAALQGLHVAACGFLYGALLLITNSIWPGIFLHAAWDSMVSMISTFNTATPPELNTEPTTINAAGSLTTTRELGGDVAEMMVIGFEPLYGLIVFLAWLNLRRPVIRETGKAR